MAGFRPTATWGVGAGEGVGSPAGASAPLHGVTGPWLVGTSAAGRPQSPQAPIALPRPTRNFSSRPRLPAAPLVDSATSDWACPSVGSAGRVPLHPSDHAQSGLPWRLGPGVPALPTMPAAPVDDEAKAAARPVVVKEEEVGGDKPGAVAVVADDDDGATPAVPA